MNGTNDIPVLTQLGPSTLPTGRATWDYLVLTYPYMQVVYDQSGGCWFTPFRQDIIPLTWSAPTITKIVL